MPTSDNMNLLLQTKTFCKPILEIEDKIRRNNTIDHLQYLRPQFTTILDKEEDNTAKMTLNLKSGEPL